jgi:hypothetical protein
MVAVAQFFRDLLIGEVIRGGALIEQRPFGSIATVQRIGLDLRYALDRTTYGNIFALSTDVRIGPPGDMRKGSPVQFSVITAYNPYCLQSMVEHFSSWVRPVKPEAAIGGGP